MSKVVHIVADDSAKLSQLRVLLERKYTVAGALLRNAAGLGTSAAVVIAADLRSPRNITALKQSAARMRSSHKRIFVMEGKERLLVLQAYALGATNVLFAPVLAEDLYGTLDGVAAKPPEQAVPRASAVEAASEGARAMSSMFTAVLRGQPIDVGATTAAAGRMAANVREVGLSAWLDAVRQHHEGTYQHCLLVMGIVVDFGRRLGLSEPDMRRLYSAAMFHDLGKAAIPAAILDKPGRLDADERKLMETHPAIGHDYLQRLADIPDEVLDAVRHHHEYLDGSGYPDGIGASRISDVVRIVTISDIFAALIERRSYKPPMSRPQAFDILLGMQGKLEMPLVQAFRDVALNR